MNFSYDPQKNRAQSLERRRNEHAFDDHIGLAHRGNAKPLCDYLRDDTLPLKQEHREQLAELIDRFVQYKRRGRPPGADRSHRAEIKGIWVARVRDLKRQWHKKHPRERLSESLQRTFIKRVGEELAEDEDLYKIPTITIEEIEAYLKRGKSKRYPKSH